ncbi:MAG: hypothetical protein ACMVP2_05935 [Imperialibacter sp.]|uniref:hypothetical protein n=1 Tax=Imperialibacter sp. TaxID=2038411 RepID=UPI0030DB060D
MVSYDIFLKVSDLAKAKKPVYFSEIPEALRQDFESFIMGKTVTKRGDDLVAYPADIMAWYDKLRTKGVDYDLILDIHPNATPTEITDT